MKRPNEHQDQAIENVKRINGFEYFLDWLETSRKEDLESLTKATDPVHIHQIQGRATLLKELIETLKRKK